MMKKKIDSKNFLFAVCRFLIFQILYINATRYIYHDFKPCEECEEDSKIFYEMENAKCCPRCTLSYLTGYFEKQTLKTIQFYITDIVFYFNKNTTSQKLTWDSTDQLVSKYFKSEVDFVAKASLECGKTQTLNLIWFTNEVVVIIMCVKNKVYTLMKEKKCKNCAHNPIRYPIQTLCCKKYLCLKCLTSIQVQNGKCMLCEKYLYRNKTQFQHLIKCLCLTHWKEGMQIKGKETILENEIKKLIMPSKQIKENMLEIEALRIIGNIESKLNAEKPKSTWSKLYLRRKRYKILNYLANTGLQTGIILNLGYGWWPSFKCAMINNFISIISIGIKYFLDTSHPILQDIFDHRDQMYVILDEIEKLSLSWLNLFMAWYFEENKFFDSENTTVFYFFMHSLPIHWTIFIIFWLIKLIPKQKTTTLQIQYL